MWGTFLENTFGRSESCWIITNTDRIYHLVIIRCCSLYGFPYFESVICILTARGRYLSGYGFDTCSCL